MANTMVSFKRGSNLSNLAIADGQFIINTSERSIYVDVGTQRLRIGDFVSVANTNALPATGANETALYYVEDINCLAKWNGSGWTQINRDSGAVNFTVTGDGNAITNVSYNADTRTLTLIKGVTFTTPNVVDSKISDKVGELKIGETSYDTVKAYVDKKTSGIATDASLSALTTRVESAEADIDALQAATAKGGTVTLAIADAKKAGTDAQSALNTYKTTNDAAVKANTDAISAINNETTGILAQAKTYADGKDAAIAAAKKAGDDAQADVDALEAKVGTVAEGKTVVQMISEAQAAATYDDTALVSRVATIEGDYLKKADKTELQANIDAEKSRAEGIEAGLRTDVNAIKTDYLKAADKTELANSIADVKSDVDTFLEAASIGGEAIDTLKEIQDYISSDGTAAAEMTRKIGALENTVGKAGEGETPATGLIKDIADNAAAITAEANRAKGVEATLAQADTDNLAAAKKYADDAITALKIGDYAKQADLDTHTGNTTVHITADERSKWNAAEGKAHTHANKALLDTYTQTEANLADAVTKKHSHDNATVLNGITANKVSAWDAAEANAKSYADGIVADEKTRAEAAEEANANAITAEANRAKAAEKANADAITALQNGKADNATTLAGYGITDAYTKAETYNKEEVDAKLTWGEF